MDNIFSCILQNTTTVKSLDFHPLFVLCVAYNVIYTFCSVKFLIQRKVCHILQHRWVNLCRETIQIHGFNVFP